ncbi:peptidase M24, structural domain-containing protein [Chaetomium sp. MPI-CAGE-AT-0009]|nr:peptidase M24, structural domain-containing protein [Chaetomium sp. MPI-CAGE-AT-0009]
MRLLRAALRQIHKPLQASTRSSLPGRTWNRSYTTSISAAELEFGQPVYETHPHILEPGEVTPGITAQEYADRRAKLAFSLPDGGVAVLPSAEVKYRSGAVFYPFRQESNFLYLAGFSEPQSLAVIRKTGPSLGDYTFHLFCRPKDPVAEQWRHPRPALAPPPSPPLRIPHLHRRPPQLHHHHHHHHPPHLHPPPPPNNPLHRPADPLINQHRALKSPAEIALMRQAGRVSGRAFTNAMRQPWPCERELHAYLAHAFTGGAGGPRGRMIHYTHNTARLRAGETVLVDAGGERGGYVTDITRVWPVSGRFSPAQRDLYAAVLRVQRASVALCNAGSGLSLDEIHRATEAALQGELERLGFEFGAGLMARRGDVMGTLFPHHVGHYVGLDVHDVPGYPRSTPLKAGHCVTIEPGIYVPDDERFPEHFRGLAVRIEDSVCVDEEEPLVLTPEAVKEVEDIEALR